MDGSPCHIYAALGRTLPGSHLVHELWNTKLTSCFHGAFAVTVPYYIQRMHRYQRAYTEGGEGAGYKGVKLYGTHQG